jgi:hypothetical protein
MYGVSNYNPFAALVKSGTFCKEGCVQRRTLDHGLVDVGHAQFGQALAGEPAAAGIPAVQGVEAVQHRPEKTSQILRL